MELYEELGLNNEASQEEIKKAHRKLVKEHHPDKGGDEERFKKIQEAYDVLGNEESRSHYDRTGEKKKGKFENKFYEFVEGIILPKIEKTGFIDDLMQECFNVLTDIENTGRQQIKKIHRSKSNISNALENIKVKDDGEDLIKVVLRKRNKLLTQQKENTQQEMEFIKRCKIELERYEVTAPKRSILTASDIKEIRDGIKF